MNFDPLAPPVVQTSAEPSQALLHDLAGFDGLAIRFLDGRRMRTLPAAFQEFASALEFPTYFGHNAEALRECLADLSWLPAAGYFLVIRNADELLAHEPAALSWFFDLLRETSTEWSQPVKLGQVWDRPGKPFRVVLHCSSEARPKLSHAITDCPEV